MPIRSDRIVRTCEPTVLAAENYTASRADALLTEVFNNGAAPRPQMTKDEMRSLRFERPLTPLLLELRAALLRNPQAGSRDLAKRLGIRPASVMRWREHFASQGLNVGNGGSQHGERRKSR